MSGMTDGRGVYRQLCGLVAGAGGCSSSSSCACSLCLISPLRDIRGIEVEGMGLVACLLGLSDGCLVQGLWHQSDSARSLRAAGGSWQLSRPP